MRKWLLRVALLLTALTLCAGGALAGGEFLVSDEPPADSGSLWMRLFGVEEDAAGETDASKEKTYNAALENLLSGSVIDAMNSFARLGKYRESIRLTDYTSARLSYLRGDIQTAKAGYEALDGFADSAFQIKLCDAMAVHRVLVDGKFGYANLNGETVIAPAYDWAERVFRDESRLSGHTDAALEPVAAVFVGTTKIEGGDLVPDEGKYGLIGRDGELVAPIEFDAVQWTLDGLAALISDENTLIWSLETGKQVGRTYDEALTPSEGYVAVRFGDKWGYVNRDGELLTGGFAWDSALPFSQGLAAVSKDKLYGYIDQSGALRVPLAYQDAHSFGDGLAGVRWKKRWGFIDANGTEVIKNQYADTGVFSQGACPVKKGSKYGLINLKGEMITKNQYDEITAFDPVYHRAWIRKNKLWGLVGTNGTVVLKPAWGTYTPFGVNGMSRVSYRGKYGYMDTMGVTMISNKFIMAAPFTAGRGGVADVNGQVSYLDRFSNGFMVDGNVPTEALCGFIEGRRLGAKTITDVESGEETTVQTLALRLYHVDGTAITGWAE